MTPIIYAPPEDLADPASPGRLVNVLTGEVAFVGNPRTAVSAVNTTGDNGLMPVVSPLGLWFWDYSTYFRPFPVNAWVSAGSGDVLFAPWRLPNEDYNFVVVINQQPVNIPVAINGPLHDSSVLLRVDYSFSRIRIFPPDTGLIPTIYSPSIGVGSGAVVSEYGTSMYSGGVQT